MDNKNSLTVSAMVSLLAAETRGDEALFARIARSLINAGMLPKASGRAVPSVTLEQRAMFLIACMATDRPNDAVVACLERFNAEEMRTTTPQTIREFLVERMERIVALDHDEWYLWQYSKLEVSRSNLSVTARLNENLAGFANVDVRQHTFVNHDAMIERGRAGGFNIAAYCDGEALCALAMGRRYFDALRDARPIWDAAHSND